MRGWLIDIYPEEDSNAIVYWLRTAKGAHKVVDRAFLPRIFVHGERDKLKDLAQALPILEGVRSVEFDMKRTWLAEEPREVLAVTVGAYSRVNDIAHTIDNRGRYKDFSLFNVDLRFSQRYLLEKNLFPMGLLELSPKPVMLDDPFEMDYEQPPLTGAELTITTDAKRGIPTFDDRLLSARIDGHVIDGSEEDVLDGVQGILSDEDPDVVYTDGGDSFAIPYLYRRAKAAGMDQLRLGRDADNQRTDRKGKSYFTYGQIKFKPPSYKLRGRIHIDRTSSFMFMESGLNGLTDLSRISGVPLQELSRLSPGSAISAMQVNQAIRDGCAVLWKKNVPEGFKTAEELIVADRGGFIYEPRVGIHDRVLEVDFTSLYPNIMVRFNISPETVLCGCCKDPARRVPMLGYGICDRRVGLIPRVLKPVVERRSRLKRLVRAGVGDTKVYKERVDILKWLLVTCLDGETEVPFRRDGRFRIETIEDIVEDLAYGPTGEFAVEDDLKLFGVDESINPSLKNVERVFKFPAPERMIRVLLDDGTELCLTPDHPSYAIRAGALELVSAHTLSKGDCLPSILPFYVPESRTGKALDQMRVEAVESVRPSGRHVYCFGVSEPLHGFALANGVLTHNCFGYTGYKNARFGRIECHEAINAYGRELMLQASDIAEAHGYEILHGIVDSLWLKGDGAPERFCEHVSGHTGISLEPEGVYKWIVFLPDRAHGVGVLNRYYGVFEDGRMKVRGLEVRRADAPPLVKDMQQELLSQFAKASDSQQFIELIPTALDIVDAYVEEVRAQAVPPAKLLITKRVSKSLGEYRQLNDSVAALAQLDFEGFDVNPGEALRYIIRDRGSKDTSERVKVDTFVCGDESYDSEAYVDLMLRAVEGMLLPFGYGLERLRELFEARKGRGR